MSRTQFEKLFEPVRIGQMELRNRIVMPPMGTNLGTEDGYVSEQIKDYYEQRARGGVGLIIVEVTCVDPVGRAIAHQLALYDDRFIPGMSELVQVIQGYGAKAALQLHHGGRETKSKITRLQPVAPSPIPSPGDVLWASEAEGELPRELTVEEIADIVARFAKAAERAKRAGFDAIELHAASGYLIAQFLSSASNKRQDSYGGELKSKARLLIEIIQAIKEAVGQDYPVWCRINGREYGVSDGITRQESQEVARMAQAAGADAIHVSAFTWGLGPRTLPPMSEPSGSLMHLAEGVKKAVTIPVIAVGRIDPELGERVLHEQKADLIAMGRALIADPELPNKAASGRLDDITPCITCLSCVHSLFADEGMRCLVNAAVGREQEYRISPAKKTKEVLVVGGGPAGMEAARVAALRGHRVTLYEKEHRLGGQLLLASKPPHKSRIEDLTNYLVTQVGKLGVKIELGKEADHALVEETGPDGVIIATGATPFIPEIPGVDRAKVVTAGDVLAGKAKVGERVIVIGGELVGCETAEFLAEEGKRVTITRRGPMMAAKVRPTVRQLLLNRLAAKGVTMLTGVKYERMTDEGLIVTTKEGEKLTIEADAIVFAAGARSDTKLLESLQNKVSEIYPAGDCVEPRRIMEAIAEGSRIAHAI